MSDIWGRVRGLVGRTIPLLTQDGAFTIVRAEDKYAFIALGSTGNERRLYRDSFEMAEEAELADGNATPSELGAAVVRGQKVTGRQSSYIAAILHHLAERS